MTNCEKNVSLTTCVFHASHTASAFRDSFLFSRRTGVFASLFARNAFAYPELDQKNGKPCSFLDASAQEEAYAAVGQGYRHMPTRALNERSGDGGVPEGGFAAVESDLIALMTDSQSEWPADDFGGGQVSYAGYVCRYVVFFFSTVDLDSRKHCAVTPTTLDPMIISYLPYVVSCTFHVLVR